MLKFFKSNDSEEGTQDKNANVELLKLAAKKVVIGVGVAIVVHYVSEYVIRKIDGKETEAVETNE